VVGRVVGRADDELRALGRREALQRLVMDRDDPARLGQQRDAGLGEPRPAAVRLDQRAAQRLLQAADVLAHRRLAATAIRLRSGTMSSTRDISTSVPLLELH
jgi:hypothetical protein